MIIKSLRHTQQLAQYSINYVFNGVSDDPEHQWLTFQNIQGFERAEIIKEFNGQANILTKTPNRKKVYRYSEILAFDYVSSKYLTREKLQRICYKYLKKRDPLGLSKAICVPHIEKGKHYHVHILLTSNFLESKRSSDMRMSNKRYYEIRRSMERWMLMELPELHRSTVYLEPEEIEQLLPEKYRSERRLMQLEKPTRNRNHTKEIVAERIKELFAKSNSIEHFEAFINNEPEYATYSRGGKLTGVVYNNKKYRFKTLNIPLYQEKFLVLKRMQELQRITDRQHTQERER